MLDNLNVEFEEMDMEELQEEIGGVRGLTTGLTWMWNGRLE